MKQFDLQGNEYDIQIEEMLYSIPKDVKSVYFRFTEKDLLEGFREEALRHREEIERLHSIINELEKLIDSYDLGKYDYEIPVFILKDKIKELKGSDKE